MAINLDKNKKTLLSAWDDVVNDKTKTDWALFGYEGQTFELKVISKGDGGLEELTEDLSSGKIMYAFCRVLDPNTSLPKFVLINWQGEAAPLDKKGKCANHIHDVGKFFKAHVTINARTDDDVDAKLIVEKVAKSTASSFNFKARSKPEIDARKPVGSVYKRIIPTAEINAVERDRFWEKEEAEEKKRLEDEHKKADETRKKLDDERINRELEETKVRDEMVKQRMRSISEIRNAEKPTNPPPKPSNNPENNWWQKQRQDDEQDEVERKHRSESLRNDRKQEAQALIAQRSINARAVFEQNSAAGQMSYCGKSRSSSTNHTEPTIPTVTTTTTNNVNSIEKPLPRPDVIPSTPPDTSPPSPDKLEPGFNSSDTNTIKRSPRNSNHSLLKEGLPRRVDDSDNEPEDDQDWGDDGATNSAAQPPPTEQVMDYTDEQLRALQYDNDDEAQSLDQGLCARALYDYQAADNTEISFDPDDIISHIDQIDEGWWQGMARDGSYGLFPANYVELMG